MFGANAFKIVKLKRNHKKYSKIVLQYIFQNPSKKTQNVVMNDDIQNKTTFQR
jgi:hypothetical protein